DPLWNARPMRRVPPARAPSSAPSSLWLDLIDFTVDPGDARPLFQQIHLGLRRLIVSGVIPAGARLPPTRAAPARLDVARTTAVAAYEQLHAEGVVEGRVGAGTYVAAGLAQETPARTARRTTGGRTARKPSVAAPSAPPPADTGESVELARRPF